MDNWDRKLTPDTLALLQKNYEIFVNGLDDNKDKIAEEEIDKLNNRTISIVAKNKEDQERLQSSFDNWKKSYVTQLKSRLLFDDGDSQNGSWRKVIIFLSSLLALLLLVSSYFVYVYYYSITIYKDKTIHTFQVVALDSITPISVDIAKFDDFDSIQYPVPSEEISQIEKILIKADSSSINTENIVNTDSILYSSWVYKTDSQHYEIKIESENGIFYFDNNSFGTFRYVAYQPESDSVSFFMKSRKSFLGEIHRQELQLKAIYAEIPINSEVPDTIVEEDPKFPDISYQAYPNPLRTVKLLQDNALKEKSFFGRNKLPISLLITLVSGLLLFFNFRKHRGEGSDKPKSKYGHPYFWRIRIPDIPGIKLNDKIDKQVHLLRNKIPSGRNTLNVPLTIRNSVKSGGFVEFQFAEESLKTEYLFLIGYKSQSDHIARLWTEVAENLNAKDINTSVFHYNADIRLCYNKFFPNGLNLKELHNHYPNNILVVIGEHYNFLSPDTGKFNNWLHAFENWSTRYLLVSKNYYDWDRRESELGKIFHLLPAKISSLPLLQARMDSTDEIKYVPNWDEHLNDYSREFDTDDIRISFTKVQRDWIAACCLFPNLHYDLSLAIGNIVFAHHELDLSSKEIEEVFSLSWFFEGQIPDHIRKILTEDLALRNQKLVDSVRSFISNEVQYFSPPEGSYASEWFREGILLNELLNKTVVPKIYRKEKMEKELSEIYSRGLESDIQIKTNINEIKHPSVWLKLRRWISKPRNIARVITTFLCFIIPYFLLSLFFSGEKCVNTFLPIDTVELNNELSASVFSKSDNSEIEFKGLEICKTTIEDEQGIYDENVLRSDIVRNFLDGNYNIHPVFNEPFTMPQNYGEDFRKNIAVDILNMAIKLSSPLNGQKNEDILEDESLNDEAHQFCNKILLAKSLYNHPAFIDKYEFEDSLEVFAQWCNENDFIENAFSVGIYGLESDNNEYKIIRNFLKKTQYASIEEVRNLKYSSSKSKLLYRNPSQREIAEAISKDFESTYGVMFTPEELESFLLLGYDFLFYKAGTDGDKDCQSCKTFINDVDREPPIFESRLEDINTLTNSEGCQKIVTWPLPDVTDNCKLRSVVSTKYSGDYFSRGDTEVTYTATDICGNTSSMSFMVNVKCSNDVNKLKVSGIVIDAATKEPILGVNIDVAGSPRNLTNSQGEFSVSMDTKLGTLTASKDGFKVKTVNINSLSNNEIELQPKRPSRESAVSGTVVDAKFNNPIVNALVIVPGLPEVYNTNDSGEFYIPANIIEGIINETTSNPNTFILEIAKEGFQDIEVNVVVPSSNLEIRLEPSNVDKKDVIIGTVQDENGNFINAVSVSLNFSRGNSVSNFIDEVNGNFSLEVSDAQFLTLIEFSKLGYVTEVVEVDDISKPIEVVLKSSSIQIEGLVLDAVTSEPLIGADIIFVVPDQSEYSTISDIDGSFNITSPSIEGELLVSYPGFKNQTINLETAKIPLTIRMQPGDPLEAIENNKFTLRGVVRNGEQTLKGANVLIKGTSIGTLTDIDGDFVLDLPSKEATIVISFTGYGSKEIEIDSKYWDKSGNQIEDLIIQFSCFNDNVRVRATKIYNTKFNVIKGSKITVSASGSGIRFGFDLGEGYTPAGDERIAGKSFPAPGEREFVLLAQIGNDVYVVGSDAEFTAKDNGELKFLFNDNQREDNSGSATVEVNVVCFE